MRSIYLHGAVCHPLLIKSMRVSFRRSTLYLLNQNGTVATTAATHFEWYLTPLTTFDATVNFKFKKWALASSLSACGISSLSFRHFVLGNRIS